MKHVRFNKTKARLSILNYITTQCLSVRYGDGSASGGFGNNYFQSLIFERPEIGDLVTLSSAPQTEWYLSWYVGFEAKSDSFCDIHVLESIETGNMGNWSNVSFYVLCRDVVNDHPEWKWDDAQYRLKEKWFRACYKKRGAYITLPTRPIFDNFGGVELGTRTRFGMGPVYKRRFPNWKKLTVKMMLEFYDQCEAAKNV